MSTAPTGLAPATLTQLLEAAHFAAVAHGQQRRKSAARPAYIQHPIHVALLLASPESSLYPDPPVEILQAAVLHDTIEDTDVTAQDLEQKFGKEVTKIGERVGLLSSHARRSSCVVFRSTRMLGRQEPRQGTAETSADRLGAAQIRCSESVNVVHGSIALIRETDHSLVSCHRTRQTGRQALEPARPHVCRGSTIGVACRADTGASSFPPLLCARNATS